MVAAAVVPIREVKPSDSLQGLDILTALHLYRDTLIVPNFQNALSFDAHGPISAMPLIVLLLRKHDARLVAILLSGPGGLERLAEALRMPLVFVRGYWDGWFGLDPSLALTDTYVLGYSQASNFRDLCLDRSLEERRDVD